MSQSTTIQADVAARNEKYASSFNLGHLALPPARKYAVVTCMDARIDPAAAFGISLGDAHVIRNAGGNAADAIRSLVISQQLLGTNEIILVKHTGCGMLTFDNATATGIVEKNLGKEGVEGLKAFGSQFQAFPELDSAVKSDIKLLKESPVIAKGTNVSGWVYAVETGKVRRVL